VTLSHSIKLHKHSH